MAHFPFDLGATMQQVFTIARLVCYRWLKQEYELPFPLNKQPPVHMPIAYGLVDISKPGKSRGRGTDHMTSDPEASSVDKELVTREECVLCKRVSPLQVNVSWRLQQFSAFTSTSSYQYTQRLLIAERLNKLLMKQMVLKYDTDS